MAGGFYWSANSPYIRGAWIRLRRSSKTFDYLPANLAVIPSPDGTRKNSNPAHMIFECMTNTDWGEGASPRAIDVPSFLAAAQTLFNEKFGLSMLWVRQDTIENFVGEILDHIQAYVFLDPRTGLRKIKLLRADYDADDLEVFDANNSRLTQFSRKVYGETINEIVVSWTNPVNEQEETVTIQDLANIVSQGGQIVSDPRRYYGVRDADLAVEVGTRDLRVAAAPLATGQVSVDRSAWSKTPGEVVKLNFPERKVFNMIVRIGEVDYGSAEDGRVIISFTQDIFGLESAIYVAPPGSSWIDPSAPPAPMTYQRVFNLPAFLITNYVNDTTYSVNMTYPEVASGILAASNNSGTVSYELVGEVVLANGQEIQTSLGTRTVLGHAEIMEDLDCEAVSVVEAFGEFIGTAPFLAGFVVFDGGEDEDDEIALVQAIGEEGFTLYRGVLDTVPRKWVAGTKVWFLNLEQSFADEIVRSAGETVTYRLLTRTDQGLLAFADAPELTGTMNERPHLPNRPANVSVAGTHFGPVALDGAGPFAVTWSTRNRLMETSQIVPWTYSSVTPETGQTTTVEVLKGDKTVAFTADGLAGDSYDLAAASLGALTEGYIRVSSKREAFESLQGFELPFTRVAPPAPPAPIVYTTATSPGVTEGPAGTFTRSNLYDSGWNQAFRSNEVFEGDVRATFTVNQTTAHLQVALNADPASDDGPFGLDYAIYCADGGVFDVAIFQNSVNINQPYAAGDTFSIFRNGTTGEVKFYHNGALVYTSSGTFAALGLDSSMYSQGGVVSAVSLTR